MPLVTFRTEKNIGTKKMVISKVKANLFLLFLGGLLTLCSADSSSPLPQPHHSFIVNTTQNKFAASCSYRVTITTSCSSTRYTRDQISLSFGDAYGNQVYAPRLDDPGSGTFESCSTDTFDVTGPCTYPICYLYLYRAGNDGWMPEYVTVSSYYTSPVTFYYNTFIPYGVWWGFNYCQRASTAA